MKPVRPRSKAESARPGAAEVLTKATRRSAELLGLSDAVLADVLGVSAASVSRLGGARAIDPDGPEGERALLFVRVFRGLDALLGDTESCRRWMASENRHLGGVPSRLIRRVEGLVHVTQYLDAMRGKL